MGGLNHTVWVQKIKTSVHGSCTQYDIYGCPHILESLEDVAILNALIFFLHSKKRAVLLVNLASHNFLPFGLMLLFDLNVH